jgi:hypothetical protein
MPNPTLYASGTQTCVINTEHFLSSPNVAATFEIKVDTANLDDGDSLTIRIYKMVLTGGTARVQYKQTYLGIQDEDDLIKVSPPIGNDLAETNALRFSIKQTSGTGRDIPWAVLKYT